MRPAEYTGQVSHLGTPTKPVIQISPGGLAVLDLLLAKWRPAVDQQAWDHLMSLDSQAVDILQELDLKTDTIHNPSAYVQRAVSNAVKAGHPPGRDPNAGAPGAQYMVAPGIVLDEKATVALQGASPEVAAQVLGELQKTREVRNPSAYVQRALSNAKNQVTGTVATQVSWHQDGGDVSRLDDDAKEALQEVSHEAAQQILQILAEAGDKVKNPSAYVMKAVRNRQANRPEQPERLERPEPGMAVLERGDGAARISDAVGDAELEEELRLCTPLDEQAQTALRGLPASSSVQILRNLRRQAAQVTNASAWVVKAVGNSKRSLATPTESVLKRRRHGASCVLDA